MKTKREIRTGVEERRQARAALANRLAEIVGASEPSITVRAPVFTHTTAAPETVRVEVLTPETVRVECWVTPETANRVLRAFASRDGAPWGDR